MANLHTKSNTSLSPVPPVGVVASTLNIATSLARELGLCKATPLSPRALARVRQQGQKFSALLVDDSAWPLGWEVEQVLMSCLSHRHGIGYVLHVRRHDYSRRKAL